MVIDVVTLESTLLDTMPTGPLQRYLKFRPSSQGIQASHQASLRLRCYPRLHYERGCPSRYQKRRKGTHCRLYLRDDYTTRWAYTYALSNWLR